MASIWAETKGGSPIRIKRHLSQKTAMETLRTLLDKWVSDAEDNRWRNAEALTWLLYSKNGLEGCFYIEPMSPPTIPDPGDTRIFKNKA